MRVERQMNMERRVIEILDDRRKELGMSVKDWAKQVYPGLKPAAAQMRLQNLRSPMSVNGKCKRLTYTDFVMLSSAVRISPAEVITLVSQEFPDIHDPNAEPKEQANAESGEAAPVAMPKPVLSDTMPAPVCA